MLATIFSTYDNYQARYKKINTDRITVHSNRGGHRQCKSCIVNNIQVARDGRRARLDSWTPSFLSFPSEIHERF